MISTRDNISIGKQGSTLEIRYLAISQNCKIKNDMKLSGYLLLIFSQLDPTLAPLVANLNSGIVGLICTNPCTTCKVMHILE